MESIIRRTIVIVEEKKAGGELVNRTINEVRPPSSYLLLSCIFLSALTLALNS